jgi:hypothetical protein
MSDKHQERRGSEDGIQRLTDLLIKQNEAISMVQLQQNAATSKSLDKMAISIQEQSKALTALLYSDAERKKEHEYNEKRAEKTEERLDKHDSKFESMNDMLIVLNENSQGFKKNWGFVLIFILGIVSTATAALYK